MRKRSGPSWLGGGGFLGFPPAISQLVLVNVIIFLLQPLVLRPLLTNGLALIPQQVVQRGMVWELGTYMFLHGGFMHLAFNMFGLIMFGSDLERWWGSRDFLKYYFITGIGAGVIHVITAYLFPGSWPPAYMVPTIGASGAVFGILLAFALAFPTRQVLLFMVLPVSARTMVIVFTVMELTMALQYRGGDGVARFAHLGGFLVGYLYLRHDTLRWRLTRLFRRARSTARTRTHPYDPDQTDAEREVIDRILAKISREGMGSLTPEERKTLTESAERARRRQRGNGHD